MKRLLLSLSTSLLLTINVLGQNTWIRINQIGYLPADPKVAVLVSKDADVKVQEFEICDALTGQVIFKSTSVQRFGAWAAFAVGYRLDFSALDTEGGYFVKVGDICSPIFCIANDVYRGAADFLLRYMRQQRCGFNPSLRDSCHTHGGYIVYGDSLHPKYYERAPYPIFGGWHDASDYLQYVPTTATATFQMLFAYEMTPSVFSDEYQANGLSGKNGIPDILDEAKWGLDWLVKMNPEDGVMFNQVCDDRDHRGMRLPNKDTFTYDIKGSRARPIYRITGKPQGLKKYKNRTEGVASSAAKFSSAFSAGARVLKPYYPSYAETLRVKAISAYTYALSDTGACQTAPCGAPYFYEEDNWRDDIELAATQLAHDNTVPDKTAYWKDALTFSKNEDGKTWIGRDTARHYQFYPFVNLGHYFLDKKDQNTEGEDLMKNEIQKIAARGKNNPFGIGTPFIWCSNNYVSAAITEMNLYRKALPKVTPVEKNNQFQESEAAYRDWLFGCNPWGTSMIYGLPNAKIGSNTEGVSPRDPHSAFTHNARIPIDGGLVDGPIYGSIFRQLIGLTLYQSDEFAAFQSPLVVFHDDYGDYSTDEPTMDGTAGLIYFLAAKEAEGQAAQAAQTPKFKIGEQDKYGAIRRLDTAAKKIHLVFTGHEYAEGGATILRGLKKHKVKASFFLTGDFMRQNQNLVKQIKRAGHYIGAHADKHLLYADWQKRDSTLVSRDSFWQDLQQNFRELAQLGIAKKDASVFMPPYEWYNDATAAWTRQAGLQLVNFTNGTSSQADYTTPDTPNYKSSQVIFDKIMDFEKTNPTGLNGFILLLHIGVGDKRMDKFHNRLDMLLANLQKRDYSFKRF